MATPLRGEDEGRGGLAFKLPQCPQFIAEDRVRCRFTALGPAHVHGAGLECDRRPLQIAELRHPQPVTEADQDHGSIALAMAVALRRLDETLDFELGQVLAIAAHVPVAAPTERDCP